ncbi:MAG: hypothetical protein Q4D64_03810 [Prevotellaceae bacterium]|nr:hypothetical protein [Prevotellaceae bacterium]
MKTAFQKLNRTIVTFSIAICSCMPLNVLAQEQQSQIKDWNHDIRRSPSKNIISMSYDEQTDTYLLHFNVAMENVDIVLYKEGELVENENFTTIPIGYHKTFTLPDKGEYTIIVTAMGEIVFGEELIVGVN